METIYFAILVIANLLGSNLIAYIATHGRRVIPVKPFSCWECLAFWLTLIIGVVIAFGQDSRNMALIIAVLSAFLNYYYVKSKYQIYE